jgi:SchA/CurD like domain-containing protein
LALLYKLKPGHEDAVTELFKNSGRPDHEVKDDDGNVVGRLLTTIVFVGKEAAVRVIEVEGDMQQVAGHVSRQEEVRDFERQVEEHLAVPRDLSNPEGAREFFQRWGMRNVLIRRADD